MDVLTEHGGRGREEGGKEETGLTRARGCQGEGGAGGGELGGAAWAEGRGAGAVPELCDRGLAAAEEAEELAEAGGPVSEAARDNRLSGDRKAGPRCPPHRPGGGCRERCSPQAVNRPLWGESILLCPPAGGRAVGGDRAAAGEDGAPPPGSGPPPLTSGPSPASSAAGPARHRRRGHSPPRRPPPPAEAPPPATRRSWALWRAREGWAAAVTLLQ